MHLDWTAPTASRCPEGRAVARAVETRLSRRVFVERALADVMLTVAVHRQGAGWSAQLEMLDRSGTRLGTRDVKSASAECAALSDVLPVVIALLVDASRTHVRLSLPAPSYRAAEARTAAPTRPLPASPPEPALPELTPTSVSDGSPWSLGWVALAEVSYGLLPQAAPGASLAALFEPPALGIPLELWLGALAPTSSEARAGAQFSLLHAGVQTCPGLWQAVTRGALCAGVGAGRLQAFGRGFDVNQNQTSLHLEVRTAAQLDIPLGRPWFLRLEGGAMVPVLRPRFVGEIEPGVKTSLHRPAGIVPRAAIGIGAGLL